MPGSLQMVQRALTPTMIVQGPIHKQIEWLDRLGMNIIESVSRQAGVFCQSPYRSLEQSFWCAVNAGECSRIPEISQEVWQHYMRAPPHRHLPQCESAIGVKAFVSHALH